MPGTFFVAAIFGHPVIIFLVIPPWGSINIVVKGFEEIYQVIPDQFGAFIEEKERHDRLLKNSLEFTG